MTEVDYKTFFKNYCDLNDEQQLSLLFVGRNGGDYWLNKQLNTKLSRFGILDSTEFLHTFFKKQENQIFKDLFKARLENVTVVAYYTIASLRCRLLISALSAGKHKFYGYQIEVQEMQEISDLPSEDLIPFPFHNPNPIFRLNKKGKILFANPAAHLIFCLDGNDFQEDFKLQMSATLDSLSTNIQSFNGFVHFSGNTYTSTYIADQEGVNVYLSLIPHINLLGNKYALNEAFLETFTNNSSNAVVLIGLDKKILYFNQQAQNDARDILSYQLEAGGSLPEFHNSVFSDQLNRIIDIVCTRRGDFTFETTVTTEKNGSLWFQISVCPVSAHPGSISGIYLSIVNITEVRLNEAELNRTQNFYKTILNNIPADIAVFDLAQNYQFINIQAVANAEIRDWLIGKNDYDYFKLKGLDTAIADKRREIFLESIHSGEIQDSIDKHIKADGTVNYVLRRFYPFEAENDVKFVIGYGIDITPIKVAEQDTLAALEKERKLNQLKTHFVQMASHEFRTPLATIQSSMDILSMYLFSSSEIPEHLIARFQLHQKRIEQEIKWMTEIMNNFLLLGKLDAHKMNFRPELISIEELIQVEILERETLSVGKQQATFLIKGTSRKLFVDPRLMRHVLANLLSNAFKYSEGSPSPVVSLVYHSDHALLSVQDFGIGIPAEELPSLFTSFYRASNTENIQGTGLGLIIIKQLIEMHKGDVLVESTLGAGATFTIHLPIILEQ